MNETRYITNHLEIWNSAKIYPTAYTFIKVRWCENIFVYPKFSIKKTSPINLKIKIFGKNKIELRVN